jgi:hypothetical protein
MSIYKRNGSNMYIHVDNNSTLSLRRLWRYQRGNQNPSRDHGLPGYNDIREAYGLDRVNWTGINPNTDNINKNLTKVARSNLISNNLSDMYQ